MRLIHWLRSRKSQIRSGRRPAHHTAGRGRLELEALEDRSLMSVLISGVGKVAAGESYALNLTTNEPVTQWRVNWGDGNTQTINGNPSSVNHTYTGTTANYSISATALRSDLTTATANVAVSGQFTGTFVSAGSGGMQADENMVVGPDGNLYVSDRRTNSVHRFNGTTGAYMGDFIPSGSGGLINPFDLRFGPDGNLYVASAGTSSVLKYNGATGAFLGVFVPAGSASKYGVLSLAWGPDGNLYVGDNAYYVYRYNGTTGASLGVFAIANTGNYSYIAFGPDGNLYVDDWSNARVARYNGTTGARMADAVSQGYGGLTGPIGMTFGPDGDLYLADQGSGRVLAYDVQTGSFLGSRSVGASLTNAFDVAFGPNGSMYVSDGPYGGGTGAASIDAFTGPFAGSAGTQIPVTVMGTTTLTNTTAQDLSSKKQTVTSTITVPTGGTIFDLSVKLNVQANNDGYLKITLTSPAGTTLRLINGLPGSNLTNTVLVDSAPLNLIAGPSPYTGQFHITPPLSTFAGQNPAGTWTLTVTFNPPNSGKNSDATLTNWSLTIARNLTQPSSPQIGSFTANPNPVTAGSSVTLTASNITDSNPNSTITQVAFYVDSNGDGILDAGDALLGYGTQTNGVWTYTFTVNLAAGTYTLFAQAEDNFDVFSNPFASTLTVQ